MATRLDYVPTILLVDDDEEDCAEIKQVLRLNGYKVIDAGNGRDAVVGARHARPDLLLMNLSAPLLYELTAARQIVKRAQLGPVPVVLLSKAGDADECPSEAALKRHEYVTRGADYEQLERLLDYLLPTGPWAA